MVAQAERTETEAGSTFHPTRDHDCAFDPHRLREPTTEQRVAVETHVIVCLICVINKHHRYILDLLLHRSSTF